MRNWGDCFNPRTPCGVRQIAVKQHLTFFPVSIHALLAECDNIWTIPGRKIFSFNPRTPCGVRRRFSVRLAVKIQFQSTHSLRSATIMRVATFLFMRVSIHALLAECDKLSSSASAPINCFNPRTPCGVRRAVPSGQSSSMKFQSTHSLRSATLPAWRLSPKPPVSIHALLAECDQQHRIPREWA